MVKLAVITGASRGIGLELTKKFLTNKDDDIHVIAISLIPEELVVLKETYGERLSIISNDLSQIEGIHQVIEEITTICQKNKYEVVYLVNNAATPHPMGSLSEISHKEIVKAITLNANAPLLLALGLKDVFSEDARVLGMCSRAAHITIDGLNTYCLTKKFLHSVTLQLQQSKDFKPVISFLIPGEVNTSMQEELRRTTHECGDFARGNVKNLIPPNIAASFMHFVLTKTTRDEFQCEDEWYIYDRSHHSRWMQPGTCFSYPEPGASPD